MAINIQNTEEEILSITFFAAKESTAFFMTVPEYSGIKEATVLRIDGLNVFAMKGETILPIDFPELTEGIRERLLQLQARGKPLNVSEFTARGMMDACSLNLVIA
jgi:hypothetical protein